jgi:hypothetical protein
VKVFQEVPGQWGREKRGKCGSNPRWSHEEGRG